MDGSSAAKHALPEEGAFLGDESRYAVLVLRLAVCKPGEARLLLLLATASAASPELPRMATGWQQVLRGDWLQVLHQRSCR
jgi:hypothetical protein